MSPKSNYLNFLKLNEKKLNTPDITIVVAFYKFFEIRDTIALQNSLKSILNDNEIKGTILTLGVFSFFSFNFKKFR